MHSYLGRSAKHGWAECSENPANQNKPAVKHAEAYYAHDKCRPASNAVSLRNHRKVWARDKSSDEYNRHSDYSDDEDKFANTILAAPRKRAKHEALPPKNEFTITMSESGNGTNNDAASAKLGKLAASYAAAPLVGKKCRHSKGAQRDPLSLSNSN
jgi:hypothetical protein